jgi:hypothetical protein
LQWELSFEFCGFANMRFWQREIITVWKISWPSKNPVYVTLTIGGDSGVTSVMAQIQGHASPL